MPEETTNHIFDIGRAAFMEYMNLRPDLCPVLIDLLSLAETHRLAESRLGMPSREIDVPTFILPYSHPVRLMQHSVDCSQAFIVASAAGTKKQRRIFIGKRCAQAGMFRELVRELGWEITSEAFPLSSSALQKSRLAYNSYFRELSECKYAINLDNSSSAGQPFAEATILGVPMFGYGIKHMERLLIPKYLQVSSADEVWAKLIYLENNAAAYHEIIWQLIYAREEWENKQIQPVTLLEGLSSMTNDLRCHL
eukprot:gnl/MRDRNA2_/MRDRNA2_246802_c0_seq1.p1 gnl/MRDRNA2_/MRDRNA2_246802_c0~~gnl/MRDRNA2_/MRDRNA2_246802_c0_seq1.p1  ORF type:complete len:271 (+),score=27.78 gnl/MRDRNA2_/MRDRNA2_246802_c0_seq1:59-814(+)